MKSNDGKYLESLVEKELNKNSNPSFFHRRLHDGRASKVKTPAQPADFFICGKEIGPIHLELKSRGHKNFRLEQFSQFALMRRWAQAGVKGLVLVHFYESEALILVDVAELPQSAKSWDLSEKGVRCHGSNLDKLIKDHVLI